MPRYEFITFDCYGTLIDWESGIRSAFVDAARNDGIALDGQKIIQHYGAVEAEVEREKYRSYREVLAETAARVARRVGWTLRYERAGFLADTMPRWKPFPDTNAALQKLKKAGHRLGILSNVDDDLLGETRRHFDVEFDLVVTAQQVKSYKPGRPHFTAARAAIGEASWLHAAQSNYHDIVPANTLGIPTAWINRNGDPQLPGGNPTYTFKTLEELAAKMR